MPETDTAADDIRSSQDVRNAGDDIRHYSADGTLYAYREGDEHVVVSNGREPATTWTDRVPAERTAVVEGEQLWTIPDNWECRITIKGVAEGRYAIYRIPETGVDVEVSVPNKNHLVDAWYGVRSVGELTVTYADACDWDELEECIDTVRDIDEVDDGVVAALETLSQRRSAFERTFAEGVNMYAAEALLAGASSDGVPMDGWTADPWGDIFDARPVVADFLGIDGERLDGVMTELSHANVIPSYPEVEVDVKSRVGLPDGYDIRALTEAGCSPAEAVDYIMTEIHGDSQTEWARTRGKDQSSISENVSKARQNLKA